MAEQNEMLKEVGPGLRMRLATAADVDKICAFNARIHGEDPFDAEALSVWTRDLMCHSDPQMTASDFLLVEETATGELVSSLCLIPQTWAYEGIPFKVGQPELVGTDSNYRKRGLVRAQFDVIHEWSRERGQQVQVITGIPFFYRQFGYEMGLELGGGRAGYEAHVPVLPQGQAEPYTLRPATAADIPFLMNMQALEHTRSMVCVVRTETEWRRELLEKGASNVNRMEVRVIEDTQARPVGYLAHPFFLWTGMLPAIRYQLAQGVSYLAVTPSIIRYLWETGRVLGEQRSKARHSFGFWLGSEHPVYHVLPRRLALKREPYAFYMRVPDLPAFLRTIGPALEQRLRESVCVGHTGGLKISFYRSGLNLQFENGRLTAVEAWMPRIRDDEGAAAFPDLTFLQLVFGYRSLDELNHAFADCTASDDAYVLLNALFPKKSSDLRPIS